MSQPLRIALIGDFNRDVRAHVAISAALGSAAAALNCLVQPVWFPTAQLEHDDLRLLTNCAACWCVPGSPYRSMAGALRAIQFARESRRPFLGTCGGFQHALIEYARNVLQLSGADHMESNPATPVPLIAQLKCALVGVSSTIRLKPGSRVREIYGDDEIVENFNCSFGLNEVYRTRLDRGALRVTGVDGVGAARVVELDAHPFFIGTLFQPELSALAHRDHPLILRFIEAASVCKQTSRY